MKDRKNRWTLYLCDLYRKKEVENELFEKDYKIPQFDSELFWKTSIKGNFEYWSNCSADYFIF